MLMLVFSLVVLQTVSASVNIEIDVKSSFVKGDEISFDYIITSTEDVNIGFTPYIDCPKAPRPFLEYRTMSLQKNIAHTGTYEYIQVTENIELQTCIAYVEIKTPAFLEQRFEKTFTIDTLIGIVFRAITCKDLSCETEARIFVKNEDIYLDYISEPGIVTAQGTLIFPDKTTQQIILPTSIKALQIGTYEVRIDASKEGYKDVIVSRLFGVIEEDVEINEVVVDSGDSGSEDLSMGPEDEGGDLLWLMIILSVIVLVVIIVLIILFIRRKKENQDVVISANR